VSHWLVRFDRHGSACYVSHLDTARALQRTFARAGIALALSEGMRPKPRLSLGLPLPVGAAASDELAVVEVVGECADISAALRALRAAAARGIEPHSIAVVEAHPHPVALAATYECTLAADATAVSAALTRFANASQAVVERVSPKGSRRLDLKEFIEEAWCRPDGDATRLGFTVRHRQDGAARPQEFVDLVAGYAGVEAVMRALYRASVTYKGLPAQGRAGQSIGAT
jgi:radical SAM-linked protein